MLVRRDGQSPTAPSGEAYKTLKHYWRRFIAYDFYHRFHRQVLTMLVR